MTDESVVERDSFLFFLHIHFRVGNIKWAAMIDCPLLSQY